MMEPPAVDMTARLVKRLTKLADTASKESIQAMAKYIAFRRQKHIQAFATAMTNAIVDPSTISNTTASSNSSSSNPSARQYLVLQIVHESILLDSGTSRWDRLGEMREVLGEFCILEVAKKGCLDKDNIKKVEGMVKQWDSVNAFGGPTLINLIKKQLTSTATPATNTDVDEPAAAAAAAMQIDTKTTKSPPRSPKRERSVSPKPTSKNESKKEDKKKSPAEPKPNTIEDTKAELFTSPSSSLARANSSRRDSIVASYDFEATNIPYGKVDSRQFLDPCKAIATLQIARDLRNDAAVQLSSLLRGLPEDILAMCEEADKEVKETGKEFELPEGKAREMSMRTNEKLLDLDLDEQVQNLHTFKEILEKQRASRQVLIQLLIRSRCQFGAKEAAEAFYKLEATMAELKKRKETLMDAMALEGLDFEDETKPTGESPSKKMETGAFPPLTWYLEEKEKHSNGAKEEPEPKRAKVE